MTKYFENTGVIITNIHPGWIRTDMGGPDATSDPADAAVSIVSLLEEEDLSPYNGRLLVDNEVTEW